MNNISNENHSKSEIIDSCGMDEKTNDYAEPTKGKRKKQKQKTNLVLLQTFGDFYNRL